MKYLKYIFAVIPSLLIGSVVFASTIPQAPTLFETYLANSQGSSDTTLTLASPALRDGSNLSGYTCLTIDANTPSLEYECGTLSGTTFTVSIRGIDAVTGFTNIVALQFAHHRGADVKITDYPVLTQLTNIFFGTDTIPNPIAYVSSLATSTIAANRANVASVGLLDDTAFNGAGVINATTAAKGVSQIATALQTASSTALGSSGATLVIPASEATSTFNAATAPLHVVVTNNAGTIDPNFLNLANYTGSVKLSSTTVIGSTLALSIGKNEFATSTSGTWTVPSGIQQVFVRMVGGGGASGNSSSAGCTSGGGSGGYAEFMLSVSSTLAMTIGQGGATTTSTGSAGGATIVGGITANGGGGGLANVSPPSTSPGGAGGSVTGSTMPGTATSTGTQGGTCVNENVSSGVFQLNGLGAPSVFGMPGSGGNGGGGGNLTNGSTGNPGEVILTY